ncbi:hypothetical protein A9Q96_14455 [Rhodobacterales bacterium 52_120_T64]|nr:hypothetical protein A9Q96_14455 [Rhodobacterales bacterium 52_120_T64]
MFPEDWTGREIWSRPVGDPSSLIREREDLSTKLGIAIRRNAEIDALDLSDLAQSTQTEFQSEWHATYTKINELKGKLAKLPNLSDAHISDHVLFTHRREVEGELWEAFSINSMSVVLKNGNGANWNAWSKQTSFKVYYCLSMIKMPPQSEYQFRRSPAFVSIKEFGLWSKRFGGDIHDGEKYSPEHKARLWLKKKVGEHGTKPYAKPFFIDEMISEFGISKRLAERIWPEVVPDSWSTPGPPNPNNKK